MDLNEKSDLTENSRYFDIFRTKSWNVKIYTYIESAHKDLQNDMHINDNCIISNFLIWYKFWIKFLGPKILGQIWREKNFDIFLKTINISYIGIIMFILVENKVIYILVYKYFNKSFKCSCKLIYYKKKDFTKKIFDPFLKNYSLLHI